MAHSDERLLDFDKDQLAHWKPEVAEQALAGNEGDLYRNHLAIAAWIANWAQNLRDGEMQENPTEFNEGFVRALGDIAAHLRQTDFLPEGVLLHEQ